MIKEQGKEKDQTQIKLNILFIDNGLQNPSLIPLFILIARSYTGITSMSPSPLTRRLITLIKHIRNMT